MDVPISEAFDDIIETIFMMGMEMGKNRSKFTNEETYNLWIKGKFDENYIQILRDFKNKAYNLSETCDLQKLHLDEIEMYKTQLIRANEEKQEIRSNELSLKREISELAKQINDFEKYQFHEKIDLITATAKLERENDELRDKIDYLDGEESDLTHELRNEIDELETELKKVKIFTKFNLESANDDLKIDILYNAFKKYTVEELENILDVNFLVY